MTARKNKAKVPAETANNALDARQRDGETKFQAAARAITVPDFRHGQTIAHLYTGQLKHTGAEPGLGDYSATVRQAVDKAANGDLSFASRTLAAQAMTLDAIFTEMARRMACNMGEYLGATETYARIAMKAQAGSRAAIETLAKLHQPREQTVRHVHVNEGGQAVIAEQFHHHGGSGENGQSGGQPQATGTGDPGASPALPCPDPLGPAVPISGGEEQGPVPDARRQGQRGA
ncbi:hypothetical protein ACFOD9_14200 [Novosphingobium bradum]|uniref:Phasin domain-containing protein n=1 Tax=Novosphingobium bradum TaxID=1737444 RepID=A0ABV7IVX7_9SPHN